MATITHTTSISRLQGRTFWEQRDSQLYYVYQKTYLWTDLIAKKTIARAFGLVMDSLYKQQQNIKG
ncbi:uncharacterized protein Dyak_GE27968 [Drosophila yakuba]|uniref:Uncharacterized protein n=1 Tax=Drosophila yakuba TaxID=7245 RepID=A0A0R1E5G4_DROYA|nr:uncharacterized protein Dyak_GE27968 [Drosophila yakuba]